MPESLAPYLAPTRLNGLDLRNRIFKAATFEGMTPDGRPSQALIDFHRTIAVGGAALTTVAYCAVAADGRVMEQMMWMHEGIRAELERLAGAIHDAGGKLSGQLTHCGNFCQNAAFEGKRPLGPSRSFNPGGIPFGLPIAGAMSHADIDRLVGQFGDAAAFMKSAGFDALEIHFGHGYGLSQFISPKTNRRSDAYGGSLTNRMRLPLRVLDAVRAAVGDDFPLLGKINLTDGVKGGLGIDEAVEVAAMLDDGGIDCLIPSGGSSSFNPMLLFRGESLLDGMLENESNPFMRFGLRLIGPRMFREYPYRELYFLDGARRVRDRVKRAKICYIGGVSTPHSLETALGEFDFVQLGRALIRDPALVHHLTEERGYVNGCTHCNRCAAMIKNPNGIRCVLGNQTVEVGGGTIGALSGR